MKLNVIVITRTIYVFYCKNSSYKKTKTQGISSTHTHIPSLLTCIEEASFHTYVHKETAGLSLVFLDHYLDTAQFNARDILQ